MSAPAGVRHDEARGRFEVEADGAVAYLAYGLVGEDRVDFRSTYTPPELRGRGLAAELVAAGLAWARAAGKEVIPSCSYVKRYLEKERGEGKGGA